MTYNVSFISQQVGLKLGFKLTSCLAFLCYWFLLICVVLTYWGKFEVAQSIEVAIMLRVENTKVCCSRLNQSRCYCSRSSACCKAHIFKFDISEIKTHFICNWVLVSSVSRSTTSGTQVILFKTQDCSRNYSRKASSVGLDTCQSIEN